MRVGVFLASALLLALALAACATEVEGEYITTGRLNTEVELAAEAQTSSEASEVSFVQTGVSTSAQNVVRPALLPLAGSRLLRPQTDSSRSLAPCLVPPLSLTLPLAIPHLPPLSPRTHSPRTSAKCAS